MIEKNTSSEPSNELTWLSESWLNAEAVKKLTKLWVNQDTALKLIGFREQMDSQYENELRSEFAELPVDKQQEKILQIQNVLQELKWQILNVAAFERSELQKDLLKINSKSSIKDTLAWIWTSLKSSFIFWIKLWEWLIEAATNPKAALQYLVANADKELTRDELDYTITT